MGLVEAVVVPRQSQGCGDVREVPYGVAAPGQLPIQPLQEVRRAHPAPVLGRE